LLSNAVSLRRDKSILYCLISINILCICSLVILESLNLIALGKGIGLYGGLFHATATSHIFHMFIFMLSAIILQLTGFHPRKV
jgi:NADH-ubiquinone oxidoreductase chain 2